MTNTDMSREREALTAYLADCEANAIVPDVGGAWHAAFQAGRASLSANAASITSETGNSVSAQGPAITSESLSANAGEPVARLSDAAAILSKVCDLLKIGKLARTESTILTNIENVIHHAGLLRAVERDLFPQPEHPEDDDPYADVEELPAPNSWGAKDEADYVAQFRSALAARGFTRPSPPEGAGLGPIETAAAPPTAQAEGWRLVPVEPTKAMLLAGSADLRLGDCIGTLTRAAECYRAMLAAAPTSAEGVEHG